MKNKKIVLITIVVLLIIFLPLTIAGYFLQLDENPLEENPKHELFYKGYLWFYDEENKFLSKYECLTEKCEIASSTIDDAIYGIKYYQEGTLEKIPQLNNYVFINDGALIYLFNLENGKVLTTYKEIKNYNTKTENNVYILKNNKDIWGALTIGNNLNKVLDYEYDFIGLGNKVNEYGVLKTDKFIVLKDNKWYIVDQNNSAISGVIDNPIVEFNNEYIFSQSDEKIRIYSYDNYEYLIDYKIKDYLLEDKYIGIVTDEMLYIYENLGTIYIKSYELSKEASEIKLEKIGNKLNVLINGEIQESIEINQ